MNPTRPPHGTARRLVAVLTMTALLAGACGSDNEPTASGGDTSAVDTTAPADLAPIEQFRIIHPETLAFAAPFTLVDPEGELGEVADAVSTDTWSTPDVLRTALVNGDAEVAAVPTYVGANLYNKDVDLRMAAVVVWGLLWVVGPDGQTGGWDDLRGQKVMVPFQNDMPDLVFRYLAKANGLEPGVDFEIEYYAQPPEIVGRMVQGTGTWAVLPEHLATIALTQANANGANLGRAMDLQSEWADATGLPARIPQAGIVVPGELAAERPDVVGAVLDELERTVALVNAAGEDTVATLSEATGVPAPLVTQIIPRMNLEVVPGGDAKADLERFFTELAELSPDIIGGGLPDDAFYLDDPR